MLESVGSLFFVLIFWSLRAVYFYITMLLSRLEGADSFDLQSSSLSLSIKGKVLGLSFRVFSREFIFTSPLNVKFDGIGVGMC